MSSKNIIGKRRRKADQFENETSNDVGKSLPIPISLGKPSLRRRLEDYYSLVSPDVTANEKKWRSKFDLIYDKYGGSVEKEASLARKLTKKYGTIVRLKLTSGPGDSARTRNSASMNNFKKKSSENLREESWYDMSSSQHKSGVVSFLSSRFDPVATLAAPPAQVLHSNPFVEQASFLDNIDKFRLYLPACDPLKREKIQRVLKNKQATASGGAKTDQMKKKIPVFTAMTAHYENSGPFQLLHSIHVRRERVKVMVRYVDCIRGTLTGYLLAFDKHMNMLLRDVDEEYTSRVTKKFEGMGFSKNELELKRRIACMCKKGNGDASNLGQAQIKVGHRHLPQILVRGDNVVTIWRASKERQSKSLCSIQVTGVSGK